MREKDINRLRRFYRLVMPAFKIISRRMQKDYRSAFPLLLEQVSIDNTTTILDVGTGTGGLAGLFLEFTSHVTGIDISADMIAEGRKRYGDRIDFRQMPAHEMAEFADGQFDLVTAAYSLHDMDNEYRLRVLKEMRRVARKHVVIFDFVKNRNLLILAVEMLEGSYYWDFVNSIDCQLTQVFPRYEIIIVLKRMGLYIGDVNL